MNNNSHILTVDSFENRKEKLEIQSKKIDSWGVIFSQCSNSFQLSIPEKDYYIEVSSTARGTVPDLNAGSFVFDVASLSEKEEDLRASLIGICKEKMRNDISAANEIIKKYTEDNGINIEEVTIDDILNNEICKKEGEVVSMEEQKRVCRACGEASESDFHCTLYISEPFYEPDFCPLNGEESEWTAE